jgi:hypothetical protein
MGEIELFQHDAYALIVKDAIAIESVLLPLALVCDLSTGVVEHSSALHPILHPFSTVFATLVVVESSKAVTKLAHLKPLISSLLEGLTHVLRVVFITSFFGRHKVVLIFILLFPLSFRLLVCDVILVEVVDIGIVAGTLTEDSLGVDHFVLLLELFGLKGFTGNCVASRLGIIHADRMLKFIKDYVILLGDK